MAGTRSPLNLFSFTGKMRTLHLTWLAFFLTFYIWFNHAPLLAVIQQSLALTNAEVKTLLILNVALTIPARIIIGMLVDAFGPCLVYSGLLMLSAVPCMMFALADDFEQMALARLLLGTVGAGFVIGIRLVSEWFPAKQVGLAEGIYGGWGNFGSAAAALTLPALVLGFGGDNGWRYAIALSGGAAFLYAFVFYRYVTDTPKGATYFKPKKTGALEVTSLGDFVFYLVMKLPLYGALALLTWKLATASVALLNTATANLLYLGLALLYGVDAVKSYQVNRENIRKPVPQLHRYKFKQVAILNVAYFVTFGSELAVVSMLPLFFLKTFNLSPVMAGLTAAGFALMNLVARPAGGYLSDRFGRRKSLTVLMAGLAVGYFALSTITASWNLLAAVVITMACSIFVQSGEGAVFAMVPLIKRRLTGQVAGMTGAYGSVGAVVFLTAFSFVSTSTFFMIIGLSALVTLVLIQFLDEPEGSMAEILPDVTVQLIELT